ncbi:hypothetical protein MPTK1_7g18770 [Marchantia polymorpha subsp. ruderalis]|uniref:Armadillo-like repeats domain-containing protein n=2 Tax=Marchantia polymorpha TaxID=3197 RepID=A0AAF6C172_MARPO|nr:hypothetical protein MARPO_0067s0100 [Marchantia polymorpha]BBN18006.1 hypothetical protein Mp_7g18770 [Marchantia polymorpha subsp. ruderalis]|eukprot:PTQ36029.1 hypothetical protein MARPO_0067s0100 [Marchantia polymorpha]
MEAMSRMQLQLKACSAVQSSRRGQSLSHAPLPNASTSNSSMKSTSWFSSTQSIFRTSEPCQRKRTNAKRFIDEVLDPAPSRGRDSSTGVMLSAAKAIRWSGSIRSATENSLCSTSPSLPPLDCATVIILKFAFSFQDKNLQEMHKELLWMLDSLLPAKRIMMNEVTWNFLLRETQFSADEIMLYYLLHVLSTRAFDAELVTDLVHLRRTSCLAHEIVHEILCDVSRRVVLRYGVPNVKRTAKLTPEEVEAEAPAQAAFSKILYLAELRPFCFPDTPSSWEILKIFEVTEEDAMRLRLSDPLSDQAAEALSSDFTPAPCNTYD